MVKGANDGRSGFAFRMCVLEAAIGNLISQWQYFYRLPMSFLLSLLWCEGYCVSA